MNESILIQGIVMFLVYFLNIERVQYLRNKRLIDLSEIPDKIYTDIIEGYNNIQINGNSNKILSYLSKNRMKSLLDHVNQF